MKKRTKRALKSSKPVAYAFCPKCCKDKELKGNDLYKNWPNPTCPACGTKLDIDEIYHED